MSNKKKGQLTTSNEWAKHLRKFLKGSFWSGERNAERKLIQSELSEKEISPEKHSPTLNKKPNTPSC